MRFVGKFRLLGLALVLALGTLPAFAQGCAMCAANARATPKDAQRAINRAIFVMLAPPVTIMVFGFSLAVRYGRRRDQENEAAASEQKLSSDFIIK